MKAAGILFLLLAGMAAAPVFAIEVYRWVDENGVVHFSQSAPPATVPGVETLTVEDSTPPGYDPDEDRYQVAAQAEKMAQLRAEMDKKREMAQERNLTAPPQPPVTQYPQNGYWPLPNYYPGVPPRPRPPPRPEPPLEIPYPTHTLKPPGQDR
jgi:hypothetical protein